MARHLIFIFRVICKTGSAAFSFDEGHGISIRSGSAAGSTSWGRYSYTASTTTRSSAPCTAGCSRKSIHSSSCSRPPPAQSKSRSSACRRLCRGRASEVEFGFKTFHHPLHPLQKFQAWSRAASGAHSCAGMGEHRHVLCRSVS